MTVYLLGFMGCGKTFWGQALAGRLGLAFTDLDARLEMQAGQSIAQLFENQGETAFRQMESVCLKSLPSDAGVVATGGGTPCFLDNMEWMNRWGLTVYLQTPVELLVQRLKSGKAQRPLLRGLDDAALRQFIVEKLAAREVFYRQAKLMLSQGGGDLPFLTMLESAVREALKPI